MGYLYRPKLRSGQPSRIWWVKYYVNGVPVRESTGAEKESEARRFLKAREGRVAVGQRILRRAGRKLTGTFSRTSAPMAVDSQCVTVQNPWQGPVAQADRAEVS